MRSQDGNRGLSEKKPVFGYTTDTDMWTSVLMLVIRNQALKQKYKGGLKAFFKKYPHISYNDDITIKVAMNWIDFEKPINDLLANGLLREEDYICFDVYWGYPDHSIKTVSWLTACCLNQKLMVRYRREQKSAYEIKEIQIGDVTVKGEILHRSQRDINIRIVEPFYGLSTGCHIPYFQAAHCSYEGEYGDKRLKELLKGLYDLCVEIHKNKAILKRLLPIYDRECEHRLTEISELESKVDEYKRLKENKTLTEEEYTQVITPLLKRIAALNCDRRETFETLFGHHFKGVIPIDTDQEVVEFIRKLQVI